MKGSDTRSGSYLAMLVMDLRRDITHIACNQDIVILLTAKYKIL